MSAITYFACPPRCDAGGPISDGGHLFDTEVDLREGDLVVGSSMACSQCGLTFLDWTFMRPIPPRNETLITCPQCEYDKASGDLVDQCDECKRANADRGSLKVAGEWHDVYITNDGAVRDGCDSSCNSRVYVHANKRCSQTVNIFGYPLPKAFWKCDEGLMHFGRFVARMSSSGCAETEATKRACEHHEALYVEATAR